MAIKPETKYINRIHKLLPPTIYKLKLNLPFNSGVADCWYSGPCGDLWVEYKYIDPLPKKEVPIKLTPLQARWIHGRTAEGRDVCVVVGCKEGGVLFHPFQIKANVGATPFNSWIIPDQEIANFIKDKTT